MLIQIKASVQNTVGGNDDYLVSWTKRFQGNDWHHKPPSLSPIKVACIF